MKNENYQDYYNFLTQNVFTPFYEKRLDFMKTVTLDKILTKKNPYLLKAKNILSPEELIKSVIDAFLISKEKTIFGNLKVYHGKINEMALEFGKNFLSADSQIDWLKLIDHVSRNKNR
jgi:hypothetical protein